MKFGQSLSVGSRAERLAIGRTDRTEEIVCVSIPLLHGQTITSGSYLREGPFVSSRRGLPWSCFRPRSPKSLRAPLSCFLLFVRDLGCNMPPNPTQIARARGRANRERYKFREWEGRDSRLLGAQLDVDGTDKRR